MKNFSKIIISGIFAIFFISCDIKVDIKSTNSGTSVEFNSIAQKGFEKLINSLGTENQNYIDTKEIASALEDFGFKNVNANSKNNINLSIFFDDDKNASALISSGIFEMENGILVEDFSASSLKKCYDSSSEEFTQFLDLLLAPVFYDETMTKDEYLEIIASFYGDDVANELKKSKITFNIQNGTKKNKNEYYIVDLLCGENL